jgi:Big-like domain-containing protein
MRSIATWLACSLAVALSACGGGGGGDSPPPSPPPAQPQPQTIAFATAGPVSRPLADATYTNAASGGAGTGTITYSSSNTGVATVSAAGVATFVAAGSTTITANKAADANYLAASANYQLEITVPPAPQAQTIAFATPGAVTRPLADGSYSNAASGGPGTGAITYQSSNTAVATVNATGVVTFVAAGATTITANKAADALYLAATASYALTITAPVVAQPQTIAFATAGPVTRPIADGSYTNAASGGAGTGAITYQSSSTAVATVNSTGVVTFVTAGQATITASKAADANYLAATASYSLTISPPPAPQPQTIAFANPGSISRPISDVTYTNTASGGAGTGAITYQSSNTAVATVSNAGVATFVTAGTTTITASKAADANWLAATTSYSLTITSASAVTFQAWMGETDTQVAFSPSAASLDFLRSTQLDCNAANFPACTGTAASVAGSTPTTDTIARLDRPVNWWLRRGAVVSPPLRINPTRFTPRYRASAVSWRGKLWLVGGRPMPLLGGGTSSEVWNSDDGNQWTRVTADGGFPGRTPGSTAVFNDRLWLLGGMQGSSGGLVTWNNDVWSSGDGITWRRDVLSAPWPGRSGHGAFEFNGKLWVVGGYPSPFGAEEGGDDAWSSVDGITWTEETHDAPFAKGASATVMNGRIYTLGGSENNVHRTDVYSSADGRTWRLENATPPFAFRHEFMFASLSNRLYLMGGLTSVTTNDRTNEVWSSANGVDWVQETPAAAFSPRGYSGVTAHNGRLYLLGGFIGDFDNTLIDSRLFAADDVWSTTNGSQWVEHSPHADGIWQGKHHALVHNGRMWLVGGWDNQPRADSWSSADGMTWTRQPAGTLFTPAVDAEVTVHNGEFWMGGTYIDPNDVTTVLNEVWHSPDATHWTRATASPGFGPRSGYQMVSFNNQLLVMGGYALHSPIGFEPSNEVYRSADGVTWTQVTQVAPFTPNANAKALVLNGRLYLIGGVGGLPGSDVWSTADGATWEEEGTGTPLRSWRRISTTVHGGKLWITAGGRPGAPYVEFNNLLYSSTDGKTWTQVTGGPRYPARADASMLSFDNKLWVFGGTDLTTLRNDIWVSADNGVNWRMRYAGTIPYP